MGGGLSLKVAGNGIATVTGDSEERAKIFCGAPGSGNNDGVRMSAATEGEETILPGGKYIIEIGSSDGLHGSKSAIIARMEALEAQNARLMHQLQCVSNVVGGMQVRTEGQDFTLMMNEWLNTAEGSPERARAEDTLVGKFVKDMCVLVSDMSGFSRICKEEGILHFLSLVKTMQSICIPIVEEYGGELVKVAADNLFFVFKNNVAGVEAACAMMEAANKYSGGRGRNDAIRLSIGLASGSTWLLRGTDVFGDTANVAFELGENIADNEIIVTDTIRSELKVADPDSVIWQIDRRENDIGAEAFTVKRLRSLDVVVPNCPLPILNAPINAEEPPAFVKYVSERVQLRNRKEQATVDYMTKARFMKRRCVLVVEMHGQMGRRCARLLLKSINRIDELFKSLETLCVSPRDVVNFV